MQSLLVTIFIGMKALYSMIGKKIPVQKPARLQLTLDHEEG